MRRRAVLCISAIAAVLILAAGAGTVQAAKKAVYVRTHMYCGKISKSALTEKYTYRSNGLLKQTEDKDEEIVSKYKYNSKNRLTEYREYDYQWEKKIYKYTYKYDSKGRIKKVYCRAADLDNKNAKDVGHSVFTYNSKNQVVKEKATATVWDYENEEEVEETNTYRYSYDRKGRVSKIVDPLYGYTSTYTYDSKGNLKKAVSVSDTTLDETVTTYKNTYAKNGTLTSVKEKTTSEFDGTETIVYYYKYKKIYVSSSLKPLVEAQQKGMLAAKDFAVPVNIYYIGH